MGDSTDSQEYTETVVGFINKCNVTVIKTLKVHSTNKPWLTGEVWSLMRSRDAAFRSGDLAAYKVARNNLKRGIRYAKRQYGKKSGHPLILQRHKVPVVGVSNSCRLQTCD